MLQIRLVGELRLDLDERPLPPIASRRARSLLAWLACHPGLHPRTRVAGVFWPDVLDSSARASLRTTLATLRRELGEAAAVHLVAERERVGIAPGPGVWIDVREIGRLAATQPEEALALGDGDLLTDLDDDWVIEARRAHRERIVELLTGLGARAEETGARDRAVVYARRRLELDPLSEDAARVLMARLAATGDRAAAVAVYEGLRTALRRDLAMAPSAQTRALVESLRAEPAPAPAPARVQALPPALARPDQAPLVGRREQLATLRSARRAARTGAAHVVVLVGAAGSGKTRLLTELADEARADGDTVLAGRCLEDGVVAFAPFTEALRQWVAATPDPLPAWVLAELARLLPELGAEARAPEGEPQDARHRLFEAVAATIGRAAQRAPVLLVVEDLHWADAATLGMLAHVIRTVGGGPLLVAGSLRDEDGESGAGLQALLDDLRRERRLQRVALGALSETEAGELAAAWLGAGPPREELTAALHRRTGGNPLFVEELARHLAESHPATPPEELVTAAGADVPHGVRSVIDRRLGRLGDATVQAVRVAAVAGQDFELAHVAAACETSDVVLGDRLDAAVAAGLVDESAVAGRYRFAHALIREAVLAGLTATRRALLHRGIADALETLPTDDREDRLPELARHLLDAGPLAEPERTARWVLRAGAQATRRLAHEEAVQLLERAVPGGLGEHDPLRAELLIALGDARLRTGDAPAAGRCFEQAAAVAREVGDHDLLARAALGRAGLTVSVAAVREDVRAVLEEALACLDEDSPLRPRLLARLAIELYYVAPSSLRERTSEAALSAGRRTGGRALLEALGARHVALWRPDHTEERLAISEELIATARAAGDREGELQGVNWRVADLFELGRFDELRAAIAEHERLAADLHLLAYSWYVPMWRAALALLAGRADEAQRLSDEGRRIGRAAHDDNAALLFEVQRMAIHAVNGLMVPEDEDATRRRAAQSPAGAAWRAALLARRIVGGDLESSARELPSDVAAFVRAPLDANWLYAAAGFGILAARLGDGVVAGELYPRLLPYAHRIVTVGRGCYCTGSALLSAGLLAATLGDRDGATAHLTEAARRNDELDAVFYAAAARAALYDLRGSQGRAPGSGWPSLDDLLRQI